MFLTLAQTPKPGGGGGSFLIFLPLILLFYFFMIRPQRRQRDAMQQLMASLQVGDEIETIAGTFGTIRQLSEDFAWVEIAPGTTVKMARRAIRRKVVEEQEAEQEEGS